MKQYISYLILFLLSISLVTAASFRENFDTLDDISEYSNIQISSGLLNSQPISTSEFSANSDMILLLHLNGNSLDSSGNNYLSTAYGSDPIKEPTYISTGRYLGAASFDGKWGESDYLSYPDDDNQDLGIDQDFAISFWFRKDTPNNIREMFLIDRGSLIGWDIHLENNQFNIVYATGAWHSFGVSNFNQYFDGNWHHVAINYDRDSDCVVYVDSVEVARRDLAGWSGSLSNGDVIMVGHGASWGSSFEYPLNGDMDEVAIFTRLLTTQEIQNHYNSFTNSPYIISNAINSVDSIYTLDEVSWSSVQDNFDVFVSSDNTNWIKAENGDEISSFDMNFPSNNLYYKINFHNLETSNLDYIDFTYGNVGDTTPPSIVETIRENFQEKTLITFRTDEISSLNFRYRKVGDSSDITLISGWKTKHDFELRYLDLDSEYQYWLDLTDAYSNSISLGPYNFKTFGIVNVNSDQTLNIDFRSSSYIYEDGLFDVACDQSGCYPTTGVRPIDLNIEALWKLENLDDDRTLDESDNNFHLSRTGEVEVAKPAVCKHGYCLDFSSGDENFVRGGDGPFARGAGPDNGYTFSFWVYPRESSGYVFASFYSSRVHYYNGALRYTIQSTPNFNSISLSEEMTDSLLNKWSQLTYRYDPATNGLSVFLNGILVETKTINFDDFQHSPSLSMTIGNSMDTSMVSAQFDGMVDEFVVYNYPLSDEDILLLYTEENSPSTLSSNFLTKELHFDHPINSFSGNIQETNPGSTIVQFSTDGGYKWCDFISNTVMDRETYCYFPTDVLQLKFSPKGDTLIQSLELETSSVTNYESMSSFPIGMNLGSLSYYGSQILFADVMKRSTRFAPEGYQWWATRTIDTSSGVYDENGYPLYAPMSFVDDLGNPVTERGFETLLYLNGGGNYPFGEFVLLFEGDGSIRITGDSGTHVIDSDGSSEKRYTFTIGENDRSSTGMSMRITRSNVDNHIRNIRLILPDHEETYETNPFYLPLLDMFENFEAFRFMDLLRTNNQQLESWENVKPKSFITQSGSYPYGSGVDAGVSPEYLIELSNIANVDPWFCIPHKADDTYIRNLAALIHSNLNSDLSVYVEYSNEIWNGMFDQSGYSADMGIAQGLDTNRNVARNKYVAKRSAEIFKIFEDEFGVESARVINVMPGFAAGSSTLSAILSYQSDPTINPEGIMAEAIAIAPYIHISDGDVYDLEENINDTSFKRVAELCLEGIYAGNKAHIEAHQDLAEQYNAKLIAYEGGQHLGYNLDPNQPDERDLMNLYITLNRDTIIADLTATLFEVWGENTDGLFSYFSSVGTYGRYGSWGAYESMTPVIDTAKSIMLKEWTNARAGIIPDETCNDGIRNQDETGVDCGGICDTCPIHPADTDRTGDSSGVIDLVELNSYVQSWKGSNSISLSQLIEAIRLWKT